MIYPQKLSSRKKDKLIGVLLLISIVISLTLFFINRITSPNMPWSAIANSGIIYIWITVIYSIKRNTNIAAHVLLQMIAISFLIFYIDKRLNFQKWSIYIGIPIVLIISNVTMLVLSIICYKKYSRYVMYQLIIVILSIIPFILNLNGVIEFRILNQIAIGVSVFNFIISLILSHKEFYKILLCKFHM